MEFCEIRHMGHQVDWRSGVPTLFSTEPPIHIAGIGMRSYMRNHQEHLDLIITYELGSSKTSFHFMGTWNVTYHPDGELQDHSYELEHQIATDVLERTWPLFLYTITIVQAMCPETTPKMRFARATEIFGETIIDHAADLVRCSMRALEYHKVFATGSVPLGWEDIEDLGFQRCDTTAHVQENDDGMTWRAQTIQVYDGEDGPFSSAADAMAFIDTAIGHTWSSHEQRVFADLDVN